MGLAYAAEWRACRPLDLVRHNQVPNRMGMAHSHRPPMHFRLLRRFVFSVCPDFRALIEWAGILFLLLPDTPRYYYMRGNEAKGDEVLCRLNDKPLDHPFVQLTKREILGAIEHERSSTNKLHWKQFLNMGIVDKSELRIIRRRRCLAPSLFLLTPTQCGFASGLLTCANGPESTLLVRALSSLSGSSSDPLSVYYSTILFVNIGIQSGLVTLLAAILATVFALGAVPLIWTIERINRRTIMGWGAVGLALTMMAFIGAFVQMVARPPLIKLRQCALVFPTRLPFHSGWPSASSLRSSSSSDTPGKALCALY
jgi:hypothetical protein